MNKLSKIYIAGHKGLVGSAIFRELTAQGYENIITKSIEDLDLRDQKNVHQFFAQEKPEYVFLAAAKVGGIQANFQYPADFIYDNLMIEANVIHAAYENNIQKLLFLGSSCIYPRVCSQPIKEEYLLTGLLEKTNEPYALAKIAGIGLCQSYNRQYKTKFISCMPTNLYGPGDNFDEQTSHVLPALIGRFYKAMIQNQPTVTIWGTGTPRREFLYVDDLAQACVFLMNTYENDLPINIGTGIDISIIELAQLIAQVVGYKGALDFDGTRPDGTPQKLLDVTRVNYLGWHARTSLEEGIIKTIEWYKNNMIKIEN